MANMKRKKLTYKLVLFMFLSLLMFVGCSKQHKVKELLTNKGIVCDSIGQVDSVMGYSDSFAELLEACNASMKMDSAFRQIPLHPHNDSYALSAKYWAKQTYELKCKSATSDLVHALRSHEKEFLGWKVEIAKTNLTKKTRYVVYVDENIKSILGMEAFIE